jgi:hypothetical protein
MRRYEGLICKYLGKILLSFDESYSLPYGFVVFSAVIMVCLLLVVAPLLPAEKKNKVCFLIVIVSLQFILGMKKGQRRVAEEVGPQRSS